MAGIADDYARELDRLGERAEANTIALLRTSLANVLRDLRRSYSQYLETLGPLEQDPAGNPIRRPGAYTAGESAVKFRAILRDASGFLNDTELQAWQAQFEQDLRQATELGGRIGQDLSELVMRPDEVVPFTGADPLVVRTAAAISGAYIQGESARFRDQIVQIVGEGASRGWGPKRLELGIREALEGADDPNGITQRMGLKQRAALIARSELANAYVRATIERSQRQGFGYVRVLASNDERVCPICASRNGRVYPADRISMPWHPRCRCVAVAVVNEAVEETDPESREVLLDNKRWRKEHDRGVEVYARGRHKQKIETLRRQVERAKDGDRKDQLSAQLDRLIERGPDIVKARTELAQALKTPTASEKRLFGKDAKPLQESVALFRGSKTSTPVDAERIKPAPTLQPAPPPPATPKPAPVPGLSQSALKRVNASNAIDVFRSQELIYEERGYNAKPELVGTRKELAKRSDLIQDPSGRATILARGVTNDEDGSTTYVDDFKRGDKHYVGWGNWGNGTYAASGSDSRQIAFEYTGLKSYSNAKETYGANLNEEANKSVITFGVKKSANVVQCSTMEEFKKFEEETVGKANEALRKAGNTSGAVSDLGLAAAIVGIDAYSLPAPSEFSNSSRYWVVLNRGAVVVAEDGQWT